MKRLLVSLLLLSVLVSACSTPGSPVLVEVTATPSQPSPTNTPEPGEEISPAVRAALEALAASLGIAVEDITVISSEAVEWSDSCLGVVRIDAICALGIVPGFRVLLSANGQVYEYHTNADGSVLTPADGMPAEPAPEIVEAARQALADALGIDLSAVLYLSTLSVEWPDACLGLTLPGQMCAEVITPGYLINLEVNSQAYEYHTNADGSVVRPGNLLLTWERNGGIAGFCDTLVLFASGEAEGLNCSGNGAALVANLTAEERAQLEAWTAEYGSVVIEQSITPMPADGMSVKLVLYGTGTAQPDAAAQDAMVLWAQNIYNRLAE